MRIMTRNKFKTRLILHELLPDMREINVQCKISIGILANFQLVFCL